MALPGARAQTSSPHGPVKGDYSQEAAVVEEMSTKIAFDNDGKFTREQTSRVHVQTDAGVKQWGLLRFPFQSATETVEIDYVRVRKADGSTLITPPDNVQDLDSEITRAAPFYSDLREKHVAVKGLSNGDILEFQAHWHSTKPLIPGQFCFQYNFHHEGVVLDERLEIKVPSERAVKVKGPLATQTVSTEAGSRIYTWTYSRLQSAKEPASDEKKEREAALGRLPPPDVQISSFQSWEEVGRWYWNLQKDRIEPTPAIRAKAAELTKGMTDDAAKLRSLYAFVSTHYRYIGIAFGIGRYQPHAADDVLTNNYGDCKDKHTLLASLLQASGITLYPALINSNWTLDPDIPSPAQFNHVIGYLPRGKDAVWLDTTPEVAPSGFLVPTLSDKQALVMSGEKSIQLVSTPADPPMPSTQAFKIDGKLSDDGTFDAKVEDTTRGETEVSLRAAFRQIPQPQWKDLVQQISYGLGYAGTVSDVSAGTPDAIGEPFHFSYSYNRKDYPTWMSDQQFTVPGLPFYMPPVRDDAKYPVWLGPSQETVSDSKVELPKGYRPLLPLNVDLKYDFAEYHASYSQDQGALVAKRRLLIKLHEVPVAELDDYRTFLKNLRNDVNRFVQTATSSATLIPNVPGTPNGPPPNPVPSFVTAIRDLPASASSDANQLESDARAAALKHDLPAAVSSLYRAVAADPKFTRAWVALGSLLLEQKQTDAGVEAFHKAMASDPTQPAIPKALGYSLMANSKFEDAIPVWQDYTKAHPDEVDGPANLGSCLLKLKRYTEAAAAYEGAVKIKQDRPNLQASLASAYLLAGEREKAGAAFAKLAEVDPEGNYFNDAAYQMANADFQLPLALDYAKKAVRKAEEESQKITLPDLKQGDLGKIFKVAAYWDTLGWVQERMSNLDVAEQYLQASWKLTQDGVVAGHLCHLYRRTHKIASAIEMCRLALYRIPLSGGLALTESATEIAAAQENLNHLTGGAAKSKSTVDASDLVIRERTFKLPRFLPGTQSAEFFVLLASDGKSKTFKVEDVKFISGSDKMKLQGKQLKSINFNVPAPSDVPTRFVRRGILGCYQYTGCSFVVLDPATVHSLD
jgi:tetratricopeptide (TPR) repeat protein/transglutaminase-like putative cysteine protease